MTVLLNMPGLFLPLCTVLLLVCGWAGAALRRGRPEVVNEDHKDHFNTMVGAVLGMLALLLGFTFSMAVARYDVRRQLQVDEANSIGTTYLRTELLPEPQRSASRTLFVKYVDARIRFYAAGNDQIEIDAAMHDTGAMQAQLWRLAMDAVNARTDVRASNYIASLNDTIDVSEKRMAALENRIPRTAWALLLFFSVTAVFLTGVGMPRPTLLLLIVLPVVLACALTLVLDLDAPRSGLIKVDQTSMQRLQKSLGAK